MCREIVHSGDRNKHRPTLLWRFCFDREGNYHSEHKSARQAAKDRLYFPRYFFLHTICLVDLADAEAAANCSVSHA